MIDAVLVIILVVLAYRFIEQDGNSSVTDGKTAAEVTQSAKVIPETSESAAGQQQDTEGESSIYYEFHAEDDLEPIVPPFSPLPPSPASTFDLRIQPKSPCQLESEIVEDKESPSSSQLSQNQCTQEVEENQGETEEQEFVKEDRDGIMQSQEKKQTVVSRRKPRPSEVLHEVRECRKAYQALQMEATWLRYKLWILCYSGRQNFQSN